MESVLHRQLIEQAGRVGWIRAGLDSDWRAAFYKTLREPRWRGQSDELDAVIKSTAVLSCIGEK